MENSTKATNAQMIAEAAERMKFLGFPAEQVEAFLRDNEIRAFSPGGSSEPIDDWENQVLGFYEDHYGGFPWALIKIDKSDDMSNDMYCEYYIFFVSPNPEKWEQERKDLAEMEPTMYYVEYYSSTYPEGMVQEFRKRMVSRVKQGLAIV